MITTQAIAFKIGRLVILLDSLLHLRMMSRLGSIMVLCDACCQDTSPTTGAIRDYHQSGNNTTLRVGDAPSDSSKAGVFHDTTDAEATTASHGVGTAYCGRVFYSKPDSEIYFVSTGIGTWASPSGTARISPDCLSYEVSWNSSAHCDDRNATGSCPHGWGSLRTLMSFTPGCEAGTYYPNPTPASNTNIYTGSRKCKNLCR